MTTKQKTTSPTILSLTNCSFDDDFCGWNSEYSNLNWVLRDGSLSEYYGYYGPRSDWNSIQSINKIIDFYHHKIFNNLLHSVQTADSAPVQPAGSKNLLFTDSYFIKRRPLFWSSCF